MRYNDLKYNGKSIREFNGYLGGVDFAAIQQYSSLGEYVDNSSRSKINIYSYDYGGQYEKGLEREMHVCFAPPITKAKFSEFQYHFFNNNKFRKMTYPNDPNHNGWYYNTKLINPTVSEYNGMIIEVSFTCVYETPYAINEKDTVINVTTSQSKHNVKIPTKSVLYPHIEITPTADNCSLTNVGNTTLSFANLPDLNKIEIDRNLQFLTGKLQYMTGSFFYLVDGDNNLKTTNCTAKITFPRYMPLGG